MEYNLSLKLERKDKKGKSLDCFFQSFVIRLGEGENEEIAKQAIRHKLGEYLTCVIKAMK